MELEVLEKRDRLHWLDTDTR